MQKQTHRAEMIDRATKYVGVKGKVMWLCTFLVILYTCILLLFGSLVDRSCQHDGENLLHIHNEAVLAQMNKQIEDLKEKLQRLDKKDLRDTMRQNQELIRAKDKRILDLENMLRKARLNITTHEKPKDPTSLNTSTNKPSVELLVPVVDREEGGFRPLRVTIAHHPRSDMLGSFTLPSIFLLAISYRYGWSMEILPYRGSRSERDLKVIFGMRSSPGRGWGTALKDASNRENYNPAELNAQAHDLLGFFDNNTIRGEYKSKEWTEISSIPVPGDPALAKACAKNRPLVHGNGFVSCRLILPIDTETGVMQKHIMQHGELDSFLTPSLRQLLRSKFLKNNRHRLKHYNDSNYNVAIHVRRGDVNARDLPGRWTEQSTFAAVARHICKAHPEAAIHVFSSGRNDGNWTSLESLSNLCHGGIQIHLDEFEFDSWAHMVVADTLVMSVSTFSYVPALLSNGDVYVPHSYGHPHLKHWHVYNNANGDVKMD